MPAAKRTPISEQAAVAAKPPVAAEVAKPSQAAVIDAAFTQRAGLEQALTTNLAPAAAASAKVAARVTAAFANFSPSEYSKAELARRNHVFATTDPSEMQRSVVKRYVDSGLASSKAGVMTLRTDSELGTIKKDNKIPLDALLDYLASKQTGSYEFSASSALATCSARSQAQALVASIGTAPAAGGDSGSGAKPAATKDVTEIVSDSVNVQMATATSPEMKLSYDAIPDPGNSDQAVQLGFELRPDPTTVTSYHDFTTLQIAFEHVWSQLFDSQLKSVGKELYGEYVQLKALSGSTAPDPTIDTLDDLGNLLTEIRGLSQFVQTATPSVLGVATSTTPTNSSSLSDDLMQIGAAAATGGASVLFDMALKALVTAGQKPLITWNDLKTGNPLPGHNDHIVASFEYSVVAPGSVEFALMTDTNSALKQVAFQYWDQASNSFSNFLNISNKDKMIATDANDASHFMARSVPIPLSLIRTGCFEFDSQDTFGLLGRYTLANLTDQLLDGSRVTFYWSGAQ